MNRIRTVVALQQQRKKWKESGCSVGVVMTMGNLHAGHLSLVQRSLVENDVTLVSVFVNPKQFNDPTDCQNYPRTYEADCALLEELHVDVVFAPDVADIYPDDYRFQVLETELSNIMEGQYRPGHFTGMLTVVLKLLLLSQPTRAYFSEKDYQQLLLVRGMVKAFFMDVDIVSCPFLRDEKGLPLSSRNARLSAEQLALAHRFVACLHQMIDCQQVISSLEKMGIVVDYVTEYHGRRLAAVHVDSIRLIDNCPIPCQENVTC